MAATQRARGSDQSATQQEQARRFGNFGLSRSKAAETPLIDISESGVTESLDCNTVYDRAFKGLDAEEVLTVGVHGKDLVEDLSAEQRVVHGELHLCRWRQAGGDVDVENQLGERSAVFELDRYVAERNVSSSSDQHRLAAADAQVSGT